MLFHFNREQTSLISVFTHAGEEELALSVLDRMNHMLVIGKTGMGKTRVLRNIILQDIHTGRGIGIIDPHGDLQNELLDEIPRRRTGDLVYLNPSDPDRVMTLNVIANVPRDRIAPTASEIVGAFKAVWGESWGPRMERILYFALAALIEAGNASLLGLPRLLKDEAYRADILERVKDPIIHGFFAQEYATWDDDYRTTAIDPVLNKIEQLLAAPVVRAILGSTKSSIDLTEIMDEKKIFIANLSNGLLGPGHANLLGTMLVSGFSNAAARRGATTIKASGARVPFYLVVDECENFVTDAFGDIVSEARKWKLSLILAHQYLEQLPQKLRAGVLANVGTLLAFQLGGEDAEVIAREIGLKNTALLTQLSRGEVWLKHATHGGPYHPRLLEPIATTSKGRAAALKQNRLRNTFPRDVVEAKINQFLWPPEARQSRSATQEPDRWPRSLRLLRTALTRTLKEHGFLIPRMSGGKPVTAVDIEFVRKIFTELSIAHGGSADDRNAERDKAFKRVTRAAQERRLIGAIERDGVQWVYINE